MPPLTLTTSNPFDSKVFAAFLLRPPDWQMTYTLPLGVYEPIFPKGTFFAPGICPETNSFGSRTSMICGFSGSLFANSFVEMVGMLLNKLKNMVCSSCIFFI